MTILYPGDTELEQALVEAAAKAATQEGCQASAAYEIARSIWGIYWESKRKRIVIKQNNKYMKEQLQLLKKDLERRLAWGELDRSKPEGIAMLNAVINEIGAMFK